MENALSAGEGSAPVVARILHRDIKTTLDYTDPEIPPIAKIDGIDLVTEGVLTLSRTNDLIRKFRDHTMDFSDLRIWMLTTGQRCLQNAVGRLYNAELVYW